MRTRLATICLLASSLILAPAAAEAQGKKAAPTAAAKKGGKDDKTKDAGKGGKKGNETPTEIQLEEEQEGPVTAGQMTEEAAQGKRLFDAERWSEAALVLKRVVDGETTLLQRRSRVTAELVFELRKRHKGMRLDGARCSTLSARPQPSK